MDTNNKAQLICICIILSTMSGCVSSHHTTLRADLVAGGGRFESIRFYATVEEKFMSFRVVGNPGSKRSKNSSDTSAPLGFGDEGYINDAQLYYSPFIITADTSVGYFSVEDKASTAIVGIEQLGNWFKGKSSSCVVLVKVGSDEQIALVSSQSLSVSEKRPENSNASTELDSSVVDAMTFAKVVFAQENYRDVGTSSEREKDVCLQVDKNLTGTFLLLSPRLSGEFDFETKRLRALSTGFDWAAILTIE